MTAYEKYLQEHPETKISEGEFHRIFVLGAHAERKMQEEIDSDKKSQIERMKNCHNCKHLRFDAHSERDKSEMCDGCENLCNWDLEKGDDGGTSE